MARFLIPLLLVAIAFWVLSVVDCAMQPETRHRGASKRVWVVITLVPVIGGILWWTIGRARPGQPQPAAPQRPAAPDDDPQFLSAADERIRRLEEELALLDAEEAFSGPAAQKHDAERKGNERTEDEGEPGDGADANKDDGSDESDDPRDERS